MSSEATINPGSRIVTARRSSRLVNRLGRKNVLSIPGWRRSSSTWASARPPARKHLEEAVDAMTQITGQKPIVTLARKSIAGFRLREGQAIGCKVTLRAGGCTSSSTG